MRGKDTRPLRKAASKGITPAHAGKSRQITILLSGSQDHPRACGEKRVSDIKKYKNPGSPPRMRGKVLVSNVAIDEDGITPAHAGKRQASEGKQLQKQDHPRACGEKNSPIMRTWRPWGSPPRMRGKELGRVSRLLFARITPAHAGKSCSTSSADKADWDHPRACGEKTKKIPYYRLFPLRSAPFSFSFA